MKRITMTVLVCLVALCSYGQKTLELKVLKSSDLPLTAKEHMYLVQITNNSSRTVAFSLATEEINCDDVDRSKLTSVNREIFNKNGLSRQSIKSIAGKESIEFYVKISRKPDTPLATYNCLGIKAVTEKNEILSNTLIIKTWIPDPKNFQ